MKFQLVTRCGNVDVDRCPGELKEAYLALASSGGTIKRQVEGYVATQCSTCVNARIFPMDAQRLKSRSRHVRRMLDSRIVECPAFVLKPGDVIPKGWINCMPVRRDDH